MESPQAAAELGHGFHLCPFAIGRSSEESRRAYRAVLRETQHMKVDPELHRELEELRAYVTDFIPNPQFPNATKQQEREILAEPPPYPRPPKKFKYKGDDPYIARLYEVPLLTQEQEVHLFRKMNFCKFRASEAFATLDAEHPRPASVRNIRAMAREARKTRDSIIQANLRLVVSQMKGKSTTRQEFYELVSDGNVSLMRAVEKYDFSRGFKFSTYASWAIKKNASRAYMRVQEQHGRFPTNYHIGEENIAPIASEDPTQPESEVELLKRLQKTSLETLLTPLSEREKTIVEMRYGLNGFKGEMTLDKIGSSFGVTKERIRQILVRVERRMRFAARSMDADTLLPES